MSNIFTGILLVVLNFNIDIGDIRIGLIPSFLGYLFIVRGSRELIYQSVKFGDCEKAAEVMIAVSGADYILDLLGLTPRLVLVSSLLGCALTAGLIWVLYCIVSGITDIERSRGINLNGVKLRQIWMSHAIVSVLVFVLELLGIVFLAIIALIAELILMIVFLYNLNAAKTMFNSRTL